MEADACWRGALPAWLDDDALALTSRSERQGSPNDSFQPSTYAAQPARDAERASSRPSSRVGALLDERRAFEQRCALLKSGGKGMGLP